MARKNVDLSRLPIDTRKLCPVPISAVSNVSHQSDKDFLWFLRNTLAPDLVRSGYVETAADIVRLLGIVDRLREDCQEALTAAQEGDNWKGSYRTLDAIASRLNALRE